MTKKIKYLFAIFAILAVSMSAMSAKADDNEDNRGGNDLPPGIAKQIQGLDFSKLLSARSDNEGEDNHGDQPASLTINPNGNVKLNGANAVAAPAAGATSLQVKVWGLTLNLVLNANTDIRARGGTIALADIHANDDLNVQGTMDTNSGSILVSRLEDTTIASTAQNDQVRNQIAALIARLNELLSRAGYPTIPSPTSTPAIVIPTLASVSPASTTFGSAGFTLTLAGANFTNSSIVNWAGSALTTTFVSATQLNAAVPAANIATTTNVLITVANPGTYGGTSNGLPFSVQ